MYLEDNREITLNYLKDNPVDLDIGLNNDGLRERQEKKQINVILNSQNKTFSEIVIGNTFTLFNFVNLLLAILVIIAGSPKNTTFMVIIIVNTAIGIFQEERAKRTIEKLSLLKDSKVSILRNRSISYFNKNEILKDDILILKKGMQVPVDAILVSDKLVDVDESQLTGESNLITKKRGDLVYSGSFVMQGDGKAQVFKYGKDTYINKLSEEAKKYKFIPSELQESIKKIIKIVSITILPVGILLFINQLFFVENHTWQNALIGSVAGIVGMIPEGLVLLTSVAMAVGVIRLSRIKTLTQNIHAIETLARVDVLCLDKTGTLTEGNLKVNKAFFYDDEKKLSKIINAIVKNDGEQNASSEALKEFFKEDGKIKVKSKIAFSSMRKWQAVEFYDHGTWILGAPDMIIKEEDILNKSNELSNEGFRVLALLESKDSLIGEILPKNRKTKMLILLEDKVRDEACEILNYFRQQGVTIKIISGDNPLTVSNLAKKVGLIGEYLDANKLSDDIDELKNAVEKASVFGRVKPEQKSMLIEAMQKNGHTVAMTGDGINDILALKKSDCGIAMASGSEATQAVAQFVLLDSKFASLPEIIRQGRRVINNISRVASLFLVKTFYSLLISVLMILGSYAYPYAPIQLSLVSLFAVGIPSFLLALEPNDEPIKGKFFNRVLSKSIPSSIVIAFMVFLIIIFNNVGGVNEKLSRQELSTLIILFMGCVQVWTLYTICRPLNTWRAAIVVSVFALFITSFFIKYVRYFLGFIIPSMGSITIVLLLIFISMVMIFILRKYLFEKIL